MRYFVLPMNVTQMCMLRIARALTLTIKYCVRSSESALLYPSAEEVASREVHHERTSDHSPCLLTRWERVYSRTMAKFTRDEVIQVVLDGRKCKGADLRGIDLSEANLAGANLIGANLTGAILSGADLRAAILDGANLREANLRRADLNGANLREADLRGAALGITNLREAKVDGNTQIDTKWRLLWEILNEGAWERGLASWWSGHDLRKADLSRANLRGADLRRADLREAKLTGADMHGAVLYAADLRKVVE